MMKRLVCVLLAACLSLPADAGHPRGGNAGAGAPTPTPVLIQQVSTTANPAGNGFNGNNYARRLPNPIQAGDALLVIATYPHGTFSSITDSLGQTWGSPVCTADPGVGSYASSAWLVPNSAAGLDTITVNLTASTRPFQYTIAEISNVATSSPGAGSLCTAATTINAGTSVVSPGTITPTNNNATGGNVIFSYTALANGSGNGNPTSYASASGFTLIDQDTAWTTNTSFYHASQMIIQRTSAAISPSMTIAGNTADQFNTVAVALKAATAGGTLPSGIYVRKILDLTAATFLSAGFSWKLQAQFTGNLRVFDGSFLTFGGWTVQSVTDSDGNTWTNADTSNTFVWYTFASPSTGNTIVTIKWGASSTPPDTTVRMFDILNATAFDAVAQVTSTSACSNQTSISGYPNITPTHANGLVIGHLSDSGIATAVTSPSGAVYGLVNYAGEQDADLMNNGDGMGIIYNSGTTAQTWAWTIQSVAGATCLATAAAFH